MRRELYPENWEEIAFTVKSEAGWKCEECGRPCRRAEENWDEFIAALSDHWRSQSFSKVFDADLGDWVSVNKRQRFILTTAHLDHNPANCNRSNLKALCSVCHLNLDRADWNRTRKTREYERRESQGQLSLFPKKSSNDQEESSHSPSPVSLNQND